MITSPADRVWDVAVIGAGPAGLAAAASAAESGRSVALIDGAADLGGQYWRNGADASKARLHHGLDNFTELATRVRTASVTELMQHHIQNVQRGEDEWLLSCLHGAEPRAGGDRPMVLAHRLILATGAYDRQIPFPGWDLPGVLTGGGVQALLKQHGVVAGQRVVVAGTGPFLLPVADGLVQSGSRVLALVEANSPLGFLGYPRALLVGASKISEAAGYLLRLGRRRVRVRNRHVVTRAVGTEQLEAVEIARLHRRGTVGRTRTVACDLLVVGWGFTAQLDLHLQLGCAVSVGADGGLVVDVDSEQRTSVPEVWAAGEVTGVGGADLALVEGEIAGQSAAECGISPMQVARRERLSSFARAMHAVYSVPTRWLATVPDEVLVCRCEEVPAGDVRAAVSIWGATDARTVKLLSRPGMGWCQGRVCGFATTSLTASACHRPTTVGDLQAFAERPFTVPARLGSLVDGSSELAPPGLANSEGAE